mmetsp:Transcript_20179/g.22444  ORF Transcript_20179/g.22444 Transcript_20179/m.22444 type:complete len:81 (+) Transcript_20179:40-282(+)
MVKAMLLIEAHPRLKELKWLQVMQIHDEVILEGPEEHQDEALEIVMDLMRNPVHPGDVKKPLLVDLVVDSNVGKNWYEAK